MWLLPYLFGASPICAKTSVENKPDYLVDLDEEFLNRKLKENSHADTDEVITDLILKRELQKVIIRDLYSS